MRTDAIFISPRPLTSPSVSFVLLEELPLGENGVLPTGGARLKKALELSDSTKQQYVPPSEPWQISTFVWCRA